MPTTPDGTAYDLTGDGPLVVLIHGMGLARGMWDRHLSAFAGFTVLRYDLYGHGDSVSAPAQTTLGTFADQLVGLLDHIGVERAHIVGFSIGGMINRRFALDNTDRVASLVILNSPHDRGPEAQADVEKRAKSARAQGPLSTIDAALKRWFTPSYLADGKGVAQVRRWRGQVDEESYAQTAWVLAHGVRELIDPNPAVVAPTLVITAENDSGSTPAMATNIASEIEGATCTVIPRLKHLGLMEEPNAFTTPILKFLAEQAPSPKA